MAANIGRNKTVWKRHLTKKPFSYLVRVTEKLLKIKYSLHRKQRHRKLSCKYQNYPLYNKEQFSWSPTVCFFVKPVIWYAFACLSKHFFQKCIMKQCSFFNCTEILFTTDFICLPACVFISFPMEHQRESSLWQLGFFGVWHVLESELFTLLLFWTVTKRSCLFCWQFLIIIRRKKKIMKK